MKNLTLLFFTTVILFSSSAHAFPCFIGINGEICFGDYEIIQERVNKNSNLELTRKDSRVVYCPGGEYCPIFKPKLLLK